MNAVDRNEIASKLVRWWLSDIDEMDRALADWCCTEEAQETALATVDFVLDAAKPLSQRTHGIAGTYTAGCRCDECREAWRVYVAGRRAVPESVLHYNDEPSLGILHPFAQETPEP